MTRPVLIISKRELNHVFDDLSHGTDEVGIVQLIARLKRIQGDTEADYSVALARWRGSMR